MEESASNSNSGEWGEGLEAPVTLVQQYLRSMSTQALLQRKLEERSEQQLLVIERCVEASRSARAVQLRRILQVQACARARESARNVAIRRTLLQADPKVRQLLRQMLGMPGEDGEEPEEGTKAFLTERAIAAKKEKLQAAVKRRQSTMVGNAASAAALQRASQRSLLAVLKNGNGEASPHLGAGVDRQNQTKLPYSGATGSAGRIGEFHTRFDESPLLGMPSASKKLYERMKRKEQLRDRVKHQQGGDRPSGGQITELTFKRSPSTTEPLVVERPITAPSADHQRQIRQDQSQVTQESPESRSYQSHLMEESQQSVIRQALESTKGGHHSSHVTTKDLSQQPQAISQTVLINELNHLLLATQRCRSAQRSKRSAAPIHDPQTVSPYEIVRRGQELVNLSLASVDGHLGAKAPFDNDGRWEAPARPQTAPVNVATAGSSATAPPHRPPLPHSHPANHEPSLSQEGPSKKSQGTNLSVEAELAELLWSGSAFHTVQRLAKLRESLAGNGSWGVALHTTASPTPGPGPAAISMGRPRTAAAGTVGRRPVLLGQLKGQRPPTPTAWPHPYIVVPVRQER